MYDLKMQAEVQNHQALFVDSEYSEVFDQQTSHNRADTETESGN